MLLSALKPVINRSEPPPEPVNATSLLSDEPTIELVLSARTGDRLALEAPLERCLPPLKRWAHGRLPPPPPGTLGTGGPVQEAAMDVLAPPAKLQPRHVPARQAHLPRSV